MKHRKHTVATTWRAVVVAAAIAAGAGCATYGPGAFAPGAPRVEVVNRMGAPTADIDLRARPRVEGAPASPAAVRRLEYARGPAGKHTYFVDFDAQDRLIGWVQVLTEDRFNAVRAGMSADDVRARLGRPSETRELRWQSQRVWSYRYVSPFCQWFQVGIRDGRVVDTAYGPDPACLDDGTDNYF